VGSIRFYNDLIFSISLVCQLVTLTNLSLVVQTYRLPVFGFLVAYYSGLVLVLLLSQGDMVVDTQSVVYLCVFICLLTFILIF